MPAAEEERVPDALSLFASGLSQHRFGDDQLQALEAALSAGADVPAMLATRSAARRLLRARAAQAFLRAPGAVLDHARSLSVADFFARAFALVGDVESCLAMRYEALVLRDAKYSNNPQLQVSREEWLTFAKDSLDNGFYTIASKALVRMAGDGTFMGLLNETLGTNGQEWDDLGSPPEQQQQGTQFYTTPTAQGSKKARNKNFSESEDVVLVKAWLDTSTDAIPGTNQKKGSFWTRVHNFYHSEKEILVHRTSNSLSHHWGTIQESVNKFCGCFTAIEGRNQSGKTFENMLMDACVLYKEEDKEKKSFQLLHCWNILRHEPKWHQKMSQMAEIKTAQKKTKAPDDSILDLTGNQNEDLPNAGNNAIATPEGDAPKPKGRRLNNFYVEVGVMHALKHWIKCGKRRRRPMPRKKRRRRKGLTKH